MFTGIVEEMGKVVSMSEVNDLVLWNGERGSGWVLVVEGSVALQGIYLGCSIAVNGTCLTVTEWTETTFSLGVSPETLRCTNLGELKPDSPVNLERAMSASARNSGHMVQGHVDDTGTILEFRPEGDSLWVKVGVAAGLMRYIVPKGFIAVDGTSLTVCETSVEGGWFTLMLISFTQQHVIMTSKAVGERVNVEVDVVGKYVERSQQGLLSRVDQLERKLDQALGGVMARLAALEQRDSNNNSSSSSSSSSSGNSSTSD